MAPTRRAAALHQESGHNVTREPKYPRARAHKQKKLAAGNEEEVEEEEKEGGDGKEAVEGEQWLIPLLLSLSLSSRAALIHYPAMVPNEPGISTLTLTPG